MCPHALDAYVDPQRALAAGLDDPVRGLHQDREVGLEQVGVALRKELQAVALGLDLLALVEQVGHVPVGHRHRRGEPQRDRHAALHVAAAEAVQRLLVAPGGEVAVERHGVDVAGDHDPLGVPVVGAGDDRVPEALHLEVVHLTQGCLDGVGDLLLVAAHRLDVDEVLGELHGVDAQIK